MIRRSFDRALLAMLEWVGYACDECGQQINLATARIVSDGSDNFPVCVGCANKYGAK